MSAILGGIELGGTTIKIVLARIPYSLKTSNEDTGNAASHPLYPMTMIAQTSIPTGNNPENTLKCVEKTLRALIDEQKDAAENHHKLVALGVASFGPLDVDGDALGDERIAHTTPKKAWRGVALRKFWRERFPDVPIEIDLDVTAAALGELRYGGHADTISSIVYITVGTGIGAGIVVKGSHRLQHTEAGHIGVRRHPNDGDFTGGCAFHTECLEGMAAAAAVAGRAGVKPEELAMLSESHPVWDIEAYYLAQLVVNCVLIVAPHVIVMGGGLLKRKCILPLVRKHALTMLNGYMNKPQLVYPGIDKYIVASLHDEDTSGTSSGGVGALTLAQNALRDKKIPHRRLNLFYFC